MIDRPASYGFKFNIGNESYLWIPRNERHLIVSAVIFWRGSYSLTKPLQLKQLSEDTTVAELYRYGDGEILNIYSGKLSREFENYCIVSIILILRKLESMGLIQAHPLNRRNSSVLSAFSNSLFAPMLNYLRSS